MTRIACLLVLTIAVGPALAQNPQPAPPTSPRAPIAPPNAPSPPPEKIAPPEGNSLSDHLSQQKGTIKPPNVDPGMAVQPPAKGATPVIPPPGSRGGNPSVVPK
jgi:hypothetical protein